jgi:hypothetical protein
VKGLLFARARAQMPEASTSGALTFLNPFANASRTMATAYAHRSQMCKLEPSDETTADRPASSTIGEQQAHADSVTAAAPLRLQRLASTFQNLSLLCRGTRAPQQSHVTEYII